MLDVKLKETFLDILKEELVPAMGCTEPIALAYAAAQGRRILGREPEKLIARCSGNIIKNVRCVIIPKSGGMTGIEAACVLGAAAGDPDGEMEVLERVTDEDRKHAGTLLAAGVCSVEFLESDIPLHFILELFSGEDKVTVEVQNAHTNIVLITKNGKIYYEKPEKLARTGHRTDRKLLSIENIKTFADEVEHALICDIFERQVRYNMGIAYESLSGNYGLNIGRTIQKAYADSTVTRMKAYTAAASEARMGGCDMPVIINSGSGNQGIASSVPVIVYAGENNIPIEKMHRALAFSALLTIFQKEFIGKLSAFCGAVSASAASAAAITYLSGGSIHEIKATIDNTLADIPGIICDGAKISCAAKIASGLDAAMMAHYLAMQGKKYRANTGIIKENTDETIASVGHIGKVGMRETDKEIIKLMLKKG